MDVARELVKDHPDRAGVISSARYWTERAISFTRERDLMPVNDGVCLVGEAPESRRWAMAMISTNAPAERDAPSWYWITPPDEAWPAEEVEAWLEVFSASTLPAITVHEVAPGHFSHHQALRAGARRRAAHAVLQRLRRGLGALRRGTVRRGGVPQRRSPLRGRGLA